MSHVLAIGVRHFTQVDGECKGPEAHDRNTYFAVQIFLACPSVCFLCFCVSQPNTVAHLGKRGKDTEVSQLLRASGNWSSFLGVGTRVGTVWGNNWPRFIG